MLSVSRWCLRQVVSRTPERWLVDAVAQARLHASEIVLRAFASGPRRLRSREVVIFLGWEVIVRALEGGNAMERS